MQRYEDVWMVITTGPWVTEAKYSAMIMMENICVRISNSLFSLVDWTLSLTMETEYLHSDLEKDFMQIKFWKVFCWQWRTSEKTGMNISSKWIEMERWKYKISRYLQFIEMEILRYMYVYSGGLQRKPVWIYHPTQYPTNPINISSTCSYLLRIP